MDRNLLDQTHAWEQTLTRMQRDIADLRARVGSPAIVTGSEPAPDPVSAGAPLGSAFSLVTVGSQPGRWMIFTSATLHSPAPDAGTSWTTGTRLMSRPDDTPIVGPLDALPTAELTQGVASAIVTVTLKAFGWCSVDPTEHPDGFTISFDLVAPAAWPTITNARIALLPF